MRSLVTLFGAATLAATILLLSASAPTAPSQRVPGQAAEARDDAQPQKERVPPTQAIAPEVTGAGSGPDRPTSGDAATTTLNPTLVDACLDVAEQIDPQLASRLRHLCAEDQDAFERVMRSYGRRLVGLVDLRDRDPELFESKLNELRIESQVNRAVQQLREAQRQGSEGNVEELTGKLRVLLQMQVAYSIKARGDYIRRLEQHIEALREELERDITDFDDAVDRRLKRYLESPTSDRHPLLD